MKVIYKFFLPIVIFGLFGCKNKLTQFNMDYNTTVVIPSSAGVDLPFNVFSPDVSSNSEAVFAVNDTRKDKINEIKLTQLTLRIDSPSNGNFNFLESISIFISAEGLDETKIAWKEDIPENGSTTLNLYTATVDLKEYIKKDEFTLRVNTVTDEILMQDYEINVYSMFFVDAKIL